MTLSSSPTVVMRSMVTDPTRPIWMLTLALPEAPAVVPISVPPLVPLEVVEEVVLVLVLLASSPPPEVVTVAEGDGA